MEVKCVSTGINIITDEKSVRFPCPGCQEAEVVRSGRARVLKIRYRCDKCGFEGP